MKRLVALEPTPIFNQKDLSSIYYGGEGEGLLRCKLGLIRSIELVLFEGDEVFVKEEKEEGVLEILIPSYPSLAPLYVDRRMVGRGTPRKKGSVSKEKILEFLYQVPLGTRYIWGGNILKGNHNLLSYFPPKGTLSTEDWLDWTLQGIDCSGLLYEATQGVSPRNTDDIPSWGKKVKREKIEEIQPLDILWFKGHMLIALENQEVIQSAHSRGGVVKEALSDELFQKVEIFELAFK